MTSRLHQLAAFVAALEKLAQQADKLEIKLPNGAEVGALLGGIAADIQQSLEREHAHAS